MNQFSTPEFQPVSPQEWKQKIQVDLKGADYNETLIYKNNEGIDVKPFYHQDQLKYNYLPISGLPTDWKIGQSIFIDDENKANKLILNAIKKGTEAINLESKKEFDFHKLFSKISLNKITIYFHFSFLSEQFLNQLSNYLAAFQASYFYQIDPIGNLEKNGNWFINLHQDHEIIEKLSQNNDIKNLLSVNSKIYQNAGATIVQQLAYSLAHANEYLNHFSKKTIKKDLNITFQLSVGSNYFFEIAKIRTLRLLFKILAKEYNFNTSCHITATPSNRNKTIYDYNVNMLRTTTEYMSAIIGGANTVFSASYDQLYHKSNEFGERIARNQLLILKTESYFNAKNNPAKGTYYIETLTQQLAEKALTLFKEIEKSGGFLKQLKEGTIQRKIKESAIKEQHFFDEEKIILLGINKYPNTKDAMKNNLELYPFLKIKSRKTLIEPILEKRLAENLEKERLSNE